MRDTRRACFVAATAGFLTLMCTDGRDSTGPVDWLSAVRGAWTGELGIRLSYFHDEGGLYCGVLSVTIEAAPDGRLSGSWTLADPARACGSYSGTLGGTLAGLITGQTVTLSLTTSHGSNLFSQPNSCGTVPQSATGTISSDVGGTMRLALGARAELYFIVPDEPALPGGYAVCGTGAWQWLAVPAGRAP
jgi:hypothetical protein